MIHLLTSRVVSLIFKNFQIDGTHCIHSKTLTRAQVHSRLFASKVAIGIENFEMTKQSKNQLKLIKSTLRKKIIVKKTNGSAFCKTGPGDYAEHDKFMGVTNPAVRAIAKEFIELELADIKELLKSEFNEERFLALVILTERYKKADDAAAAEIYRFYLDNIDRINNWNLVDSSAHLIIGAHLLDKNKDSLIALAKSEVMWERRIAIVSTLQFIRSKDLDWTFKLSEMLLDDRHDLIHKATGWMLREAGKKDVSQLLQFLDNHAAKMPRTMLRYSLEKLSDVQRKHYLGLIKVEKK